MKITTLIPAYKPKYLMDLLIALRNQTVKPERIIFSDDSPNRAFHAQLASEPLRAWIADMNVEVIDGPHLGAYGNCLHLLNLWKGATSLAHMLLDDDVIYPNFYERHIHAHSVTSCKCSISKRWTALESGQPVGQLQEPSEVSLHPQRLLTIEADYAFGSTIPYCNNWFGEMSNAVLSNEVYPLFVEGNLEGISFQGLGDIGFFLSVSQHAPLCFLNEALGYFRVSPGQNSEQLMGIYGQMGYLAWISLAIAAKRIQRIRPEDALKTFRQIGSIILGRFHTIDRMAPFCQLLPGLMDGQPGSEEIFLAAWEEFLTLNNGRM